MSCEPSIKRNATNWLDLRCSNVDIAVFKHPYFAVTGKDGKFVLKGFPAGNYAITAWQEKFGTLSQKVTVASSEVKKVEFTFKP